MKNLKKAFNDEEILELPWYSNTKEMKQKTPKLSQT